MVDHEGAGKGANLETEMTEKEQRDLIDSAKAMLSYYGKPEHANTEGQRKANIRLREVLAGLHPAPAPHEI